MRKILQFPNWLNRCGNSVQQSPPEVFRPSASVIHGYAKDIERYGQPMDSDLPAYFRKVADYYENQVVGSITQG